MNNKYSISNLIFNFHKRTSLAIKMVTITVLVGIVVWVVLDYVQSRKLKDIFHSQLAVRLSQQALKDRLNFDKYIKTHLQIVKFFVSQRRFSDYLEKQDWSEDFKGLSDIKYYKNPPGWFPPRSLLRTFAQPHYAILMDSKGMVREIYSAGNADVPETLRQPSPILLAKTTGQNFISEIKGVPFLIASKSYSDIQGVLRATLMLASPIDDEFLSASVGYLTPGHAVVLLTSEDKPRVLVSSDHELLSPGTPLEMLQDRYLIYGEEFFDYGAAERAIKFISLITKTEVEVLTETVFLKERQHRAISAPIFILFFTFVMLWITRRIQRLTRRISEFSEKNLGVPAEGLRKGDQLMILEESFQRLTDEVLESRDKLRKEAEEKIVLEKKHIVMEQKGKQLELLQSVTETLGVGIMIDGPQGLEAANNLMERFIEICGGSALFKVEQGGVEERTIMDNVGIRHIFEVSSHTMFDEKIVLIRDVTELKAHTDLLEHMALHDSLTGLPNRTLFYDRMEHAIYLAQREERTFTMLMIDLDGFKLINDTLGHHAGDVVLQEIGKRLMDMLRKADTVARLGGDEFGVLLLSVDGVDDSREVATKIINALKQPMEIDSESLKIGASIGIVLYPDHGNDMDTLIKNADLSMYIAKKSGRGISVYTAT